MRINISIADDLLQKIDSYCDTHGYKRSTVFLRGSQMFINRNLLVDNKGEMWEAKITAVKQEELTPKTNTPIIKTNSQLKKILKNTVKSPMCEHGSMKGLCKKGCK